MDRTNNSNTFWNHSAARLIGVSQLLSEPLTHGLARRVFPDAGADTLSGILTTAIAMDRTNNSNTFWNRAAARLIGVSQILNEQLTYGLARRVFPDAGADTLSGIFQTSVLA